MDNRQNEAAVGVVDRLDDCLCDARFLAGLAMDAVRNVVSIVVQHHPIRHLDLFDVFIVTKINKTRL